STLQDAKGRRRFHTGNRYRLAPAGLTCGDRNRITRKAEPRDKKADQLLVGGAVQRRSRDPDLECVAMTSRDRGRPGAWHDVHDEPRRQGLSAESRICRRMLSAN